MDIANFVIKKDLAYIQIYIYDRQNTIRWLTAMAANSPLAMLRAAKEIFSLSNFRHKHCSSSIACGELATSVAMQTFSCCIKLSVNSWKEIRAKLRLFKNGLTDTHNSILRIFLNKISCSESKSSHKVLSSDFPIFLFCFVDCRFLGVKWNLRDEPPTTDGTLKYRRLSVSPI